MKRSYILINIQNFFLVKCVRCFNSTFTGTNIFRTKLTHSSLLNYILNVFHNYEQRCSITNLNLLIEYVYHDADVKLQTEAETKSPSNFLPQKISICDRDY